MDDAEQVAIAEVFGGEEAGGRVWVRSPGHWRSHDEVAVGVAFKAPMELGEVPLGAVVRAGACCDAGGRRLHDK